MSLINDVFGLHDRDGGAQRLPAAIAKNPHGYRLEDRAPAGQDHSDARLLFFGWMAGFAACMALIGLIPTVPIFIIAFMRIEGREPWKIVIPMAACVVLLIYVVFDQLLAIPWPPTLAGMLFPALQAIPSV